MTFSGERTDTVLKSRLAKLEVSTKPDEQLRLYLVRQSLETNRMAITDLNFHGSIEAGHKLMNEHTGNGVFVIMKIPDANFNDESWDRVAD